MLRLSRSARSETPRVNPAESWRARTILAAQAFALFLLGGLTLNLAALVDLPTMVRATLNMAVILAAGVLVIALLERHVHRVVNEAQARRVTEHLKAAGLTPGVEQTPALLDAGEDALAELAQLAQRPRHREGE